MTGLYGANAPTLVSQPLPSSTNLLPTQQQPREKKLGFRCLPQSLGKTHSWPSQSCFPHTSSCHQRGRSLERLGQVSSGKTSKDHPWEGAGSPMLIWIML